MLPMFFGTVKTDGTIDANSACSGNFTVRKTTDDGEQVFFILLDEWIARAPTIAITGVDDGNSAKYPSYQCNRSNNQYQITVKMHDHAKSDGWQAFSFIAMVGSTLVYPVRQSTDRIVLTPSILKFGNDQIDTLVLSTSIGGTTYYLDKGTVLLAEVEPGLANAPISFRGGSVSGYTMAWYANKTESTQATLLSEANVTAPPKGVHTTLAGITCVATKGSTVLSTDPLVIVRTKGSTSA